MVKAFRRFSVFLFVVVITLSGCDGLIEEASGAPPIPELIESGSDIEAACDQEAAMTGSRLPTQGLNRQQYANAIRDLFDLAAPWDGINSWSDSVIDGPSGESAPRRFDYVTTAGNPNATSVQRLRSAGEAIAVEQALRFAQWAPCVEESRECARLALMQLARLAWRETPDSATEERLVALYDRGMEPDFAVPELSAHQSGVSLVISAILQSPDFIYRAVVANDSSEREQRGSKEMAEALAFFLWGSIPDAALLDAAESGELATAEGVAVEARRLLDDPRATDPIVDFYARWLHIEGLEHLARDETQFPEFYAELGTEMAASFRAFIEHVYNEGDRSLNTLMTARYSYMSGELATYLNVPPPSNGGIGRVELGDERRGLLTHPAFLTSNATNQVDDPIFRGLRIFERVLCLTIGAPPPNAGGERDPASSEGPITTRDHISNVTQSNPGCASCHDRFNPFGYALGSFDATGRLQATQNGLPIDASSTIAGADDVDGEFSDGAEMIDRIADSDRLRSCFTQSLLVEALRRVPGPADACSLAEIREEFAVEDDLRELMVNLTTSESFRFRAPTPTACEEPAR